MNQKDFMQKFNARLFKLIGEKLLHSHTRIATFNGDALPFLDEDKRNLLASQIGGRHRIKGIMQVLNFEERAWWNYNQVGMIRDLVEVPQLVNIEILNSSRVRVGKHIYRVDHFFSDFEKNIKQIAWTLQEGK